MSQIKLKLLTKDGRSRFFEKYGTILIFTVMVLFMSLIKPQFLTSNNIMNIIKQQTPIVIIALGVTFTIISGGIDISGGSIIALCSVVIAMLAHPVGDAAGPGQLPLIVTILAGIVVGGILGTINGLVISYGNVPPFIATLGMMSAARGLALIVSGGRPVTGFTKAFDFIGSGSVLGIPILIFILALTFVISYILLHKTKFGIYVYAIGGNEVAAIVSGVKVIRNKTLAYTLAGSFCGIAAVALTSRILAGVPSVGGGYELSAITIAVIGGTSFSGGIGSVFGTIVGGGIVGVLTNGMTMLRIEPALQMMVKGAVIVGAILLDERKHRYKK